MQSSSGHQQCCEPWHSTTRRHDGDGIPFFEKLDRDIALHLAEVKAYKSGMVELRYEVQGHRGESRNATLDASSFHMTSHSSA